MGQKENPRGPQCLIIFLSTKGGLLYTMVQYTRAAHKLRNACCERYRIISWLLRELQADLQTEVVYVEVGVANGKTAIFLLENLPWLEAYLVTWTHATNVFVELFRCIYDVC